jgi:REP element-mobilizing transposase RayT
MPRLQRLHVPGAFYHVTLRGNHQQAIFRRPADRTGLNTIVADVLQRFDARLHAYCWMTNHIHLLIQVANEPLGRLIQRIAGGYARWFQSLLPTTGHLFERRYHALIVDADSYLLELIRYIHLNPVRAHMAADPAAYLWSSHQVYLGLRQDEWVTTDFALRMFHMETGRARSSYRDFILQGIGKPLGDADFAGHRADPRVLGDDDFLHRIVVTPTTLRATQTLSELIERCCRNYGVLRAELESSSKRRNLSKVRAIIAHQAQRLKIASLGEVARNLCRDESSLRQCLERYRRIDAGQFSDGVVEDPSETKSPNPRTGTNSD